MSVKRKVTRPRGHGAGFLRLFLNEAPPPVPEVSAGLIVAL